jgi:NAD(P)-dependent dehydrogenase (short-subunit alcohol dehydrogenase family)
MIVMDVKDKVAIVTGASRGIGRQIALELARRGARVVVAARTVEARRRLPGTIGETLAMIEGAGGRAIAVKTDVTKAADLERLVAKTLETFGRLDILVNNAAATQNESAPIDTHTREGWLSQFDANVHAPFSLMGLAVAPMRAQGGGVIVNITSAAGDLVDIDLTVTRDTPFRLGPQLGYATTKAALNRLTNALAPTLAADNIAVSCVDPGFTRTEYMDVLEERGLVDAGAAHSMDLPVAKVMEIITAGNALIFSGKILRAGPSPL